MRVRLRPTYHYVSFELYCVWADVQCDGRPVEYRWHSL